MKFRHNIIVFFLFSLTSNMYLGFLQMVVYIFRRPQYIGNSKNRKEKKHINWSNSNTSLIIINVLMSAIKSFQFRDRRAVFVIQLLLDKSFYDQTFLKIFQYQFHTHRWTCIMIKYHTVYPAVNKLNG